MDAAGKRSGLKGLCPRVVTPLLNLA